MLCLRSQRPPSFTPAAANCKLDEKVHELPPEYAEVQPKDLSLGVALLFFHLEGIHPLWPPPFSCFGRCAARGITGITTHMVPCSVCPRALSRTWTILHSWASVRGHTACNCHTGCPRCGAISYLPFLFNPPSNTVIRSCKMNVTARILLFTFNIQPAFNVRRWGAPSPVQYRLRYPLDHVFACWRINIGSAISWP